MTTGTHVIMINSDNEDKYILNAIILNVWSVGDVDIYWVL